MKDDRRWAAFGRNLFELCFSRNLCSRVLLISRVLSRMGLTEAWKLKTLGRRHRHKFGFRFQDQEAPHNQEMQPVFLETHTQEIVQNCITEQQKLTHELKLAKRKCNTEMVITQPSFNAMLQKLMFLQNQQKELLTSTNGNLIRTNFPMLIQQGTELIRLLNEIMHTQTSANTTNAHTDSEAMPIQLGSVRSSLSPSCDKTVGGNLQASAPTSRGSRGSRGSIGSRESKGGTSGEGVLIDLGFV